MIRAVGFDIGGVLERVRPAEELFAPWRERLQLSAESLSAALAAVDPADLIGTGDLSEAQYLDRYAAALGLSGEQRMQFASELWNWYCGEFDTAMADFARSLRPRVRTGILSNSADGARREEQARYGFEELVDVIVYSHEAGVAKPDPRAFLVLCDRLEVSPAELAFVDDVPGHVAAAGQLGIAAVLHSDTAQTIAAIRGLLS